MNRLTIGLIVLFVILFYMNQQGKKRSK